MQETAEIIKKETLKVALGTLILSAVMNLVFFIIGYWDIKVLFGSLLGAFTAVLNFFLMCLTIKRSVDSGETEHVATRVKASQILRLVMQFAVIAIAAAFRETCFNIIAAVIPLIFPSIIVRVIKFATAKKENRKNADMTKTEAVPESKAFREMDAGAGSESKEEQG